MRIIYFSPEAANAGREYARPPLFSRNYHGFDNRLDATRAHGQPFRLAVATRGLPRS